MIESFLLLSSGITLFLFGMMKLGAGIQQLFTARIRDHIKYAVRRPFFGLLTGVAATVLFQSSSATTVIAVGMVSAGLITFYHSLAI
ncbi:MAG TPA: Na/Pi symporter, partial [Syntrophales bacterium]|nr:Na/Pi symporter [Syntrophales bacterium]